MSKRVTRIYACGGGAINITADLPDYRDIKGFSDTMVSRIDTSASNLTTNMPGSSVYLLEGADGSGMERAHNYEPVCAALDQILAKHQPADFNIVIFTASGGSGSVIGPVICGELLKRNAPVLAMVIGTTGCKQQTTNSINTYKSLWGVTEAARAPLAMLYFEVDQNNSQRDIDAAVLGSLTSLLNLLDSENTKIDSKDLTNFLRYTNVHKADVGLVAMEIFLGDDINEIAGTAPIAMASIWPDDDRKFLSVTPAYHTNGTRGFAFDDAIVTTPIHYVITPDPIKRSFDALTKRLEQIVEETRGRGVTKSILGNDDHADSHGMVL